jgi:hypothetical protein
MLGMDLIQLAGSGVQWAATVCVAEWFLLSALQIGSGAGHSVKHVRFSLLTSRSCPVPRTAVQRRGGRAPCVRASSVTFGRHSTHWMQNLWDTRHILGTVHYQESNSSLRSSFHTLADVLRYCVSLFVRNVTEGVENEAIPADVEQTRAKLIVIVSTV